MESTDRVVAVVQARMGSKRLPNKMMLWLNGYTISQWIWRRINLSKKISKIVFAIPSNKQNQVLDSHLRNIGAQVYLGHETNVLQRVRKAAEHHDATHIVRICGDSPFVSAAELDRLIDFYYDNSMDYVYNHRPIKNTYPDGLGGEIASANLVKELDKICTKNSEKEHMFNHIWANQSDYKIGTFNPESAKLCHPEVRLDLDTYEDYQKLLAFNVDLDSTSEEIVCEALAWQQKRKKGNLYF